MVRLGLLRWVLLLDGKVVVICFDSPTVVAYLKRAPEVTEAHSILHWANFDQMTGYPVPHGKERHCSSIFHTFYPPISSIPLISQNFLLVSTSLLLYLGIGHCLIFDVPDLSSGLSFEQMVEFSLVHSLLGFLGCESWRRLN